MSEEKLYAVKNHSGKFWDFSANSGWWSSKIEGPNTTIKKERAELVADETGGHVVTLIEEPKKVVVSPEEAEMLEEAKKNGYPAEAIDAYNDMRPDEDRLMHAYVLGWEVGEPKRYVLPMEGTELPDGTVAYAVLDHTGAWTVKGYAEEQSAITFGSTVTQANIDSAPAWVKAIKPVEVAEHD
ncbi:hypothetical protein [Lacticaseibacillus saniviri]|uniref:Uncharacterized protein n=1 Tax=Lacticaseibacillus saniviri JCM 17471 = DSM 24301 TaxID=1293598 RepID=A0A0R2MNN2_9LACO|nr:hypothetical protein [Lacticaseibacillus saniviri]KRO15300.1 hypothetical protein IV56_GL000157 [Lacticaseibacillus saniviri JCM 17471 = DSM 24301]